MCDPESSSLTIWVFYLIPIWRYKYQNCQFWNPYSTWIIRLGRQECAHWCKLSKKQFCIGRTCLERFIHPENPISAFASVLDRPQKGICKHLNPLQGFRCKADDSFLLKSLPSNLKLFARQVLNSVLTSIGQKLFKSVGKFPTKNGICRKVSIRGCLACTMRVNRSSNLTKLHLVYTNAIFWPHRIVVFEKHWPSTLWSDEQIPGAT